MAQVNLNGQVAVNAAKYNEFQERFYNNGAVTEGRLNEHKVVSGLPREGQTLATFTESPGGVKGFFNTIGRFFRRVFCGGSAQADRNLKSISSDFHRSVADIFGGEDNIPPAVRTAMGTHDKAGGKMRPLSTFRIKAVNDAIAGLNPPQDNNIGNAGADENNAVGHEGEHPEEINNENNQNNEVVEENKVEKQDDTKVDEEHKEEEIQKEEKKDEVEENPVPPENPIKTHNDGLLAKLPMIKDKALKELEKQQEDCLDKIKTEIKSLGLDEEGADAALAKLKKSADDKFAALKEATETSISDTKKAIEAKGENEEFPEKDVNAIKEKLAQDVTDRIKEITDEKDALVTLVKGFLEGTSKEFKAFTGEFFADIPNQVNQMAEEYDKKNSGNELFGWHKKSVKAFVENAVEGLKSDPNTIETIRQSVKPWLAKVIEGDGTLKLDDLKGENLPKAQQDGVNKLKGISEKVFKDLSDKLGADRNDFNLLHATCLQEITTLRSDLKKSPRNLGSLDKFNEWLDVDALKKEFAKHETGLARKFEKSILEEAKLVNDHGKEYRLASDRLLHERKMLVSQIKVLDMLGNGEMDGKLQKLADNAKMYFEQHVKTHGGNDADQFKGEIKTFVALGFANWLEMAGANSANGPMFDFEESFNGNVSGQIENQKVACRGSYPSFDRALLEEKQEGVILYSKNEMGTQSLSEFLGGGITFSDQNWLDAKTLSNSYDDTLKELKTSFIRQNVDGNFLKQSLRRHRLCIDASQKLVRTFATMMGLYCGTMNGVDGNRSKKPLTLSSQNSQNVTKLLSEAMMKVMLNPFTSNAPEHKREGVAPYRSGAYAEKKTDDEKEKDYVEKEILMPVMDELVVKMTEYAKKNISNNNWAVQFLANDKTPLLDKANAYLKSQGFETI